jgi:hypothetical protein
VLDAQVNAIYTQNKDGSIYFARGIGNRNGSGSMPVRHISSGL